MFQGNPALKFINIVNHMNVEGRVGVNLMVHYCRPVEPK
jgi:hypothetical protein